MERYILQNNAINENYFDDMEPTALVFLRGIRYVVFSSLYKKKTEILTILEDLSQKERLKYIAIFKLRFLS